MIHPEQPDPRLADAYQRLMRLRDAGAAPEIPLEQIQALAEGSYIGADRNALLERVLANPASAREFHSLRQVIALKPSRRAVAPRFLLAAAAALLVVAGGLYLRRPSAVDDSLRSGGAAVSLATPTPGVQWTDSTRFAWHPVPTAISYRLEILDADGGLAGSLSTSDTTGVVAPGARRSTEYRWWIIAELPDHSTRRSAPRTLTP